MIIPPGMRFGILPGARYTGVKLSARGPALRVSRRSGLLLFRRLDAPRIRLPLTLPLPQTSPHPSSRRWHRRAARLLQCMPWGGWLVQSVYRLWQPRFSVGVVGIVLDATGERVLLVEHVFHPQRPWGLPGGWISRGEDPAQTAEREILEETGLRVRAVRPVLVLRSPKLRGHLDVVYLCQTEDGAQSIRLSHELLSYRWTPLNALPPLVEFHERALEAVRAERRDVERGE